MVELPRIWCDLVAPVGKIFSHNRRFMTHFSEFVYSTVSKYFHRLMQNARREQYQFRVDVLLEPKQKIGYSVLD